MYILPLGTLFSVEKGYICTLFNYKSIMLIHRYLTSLGEYIMLMGRSFSRPERMRMFFKRYIKEMSSLGVDSIGIV